VAADSPRGGASQNDPGCGGPDWRLCWPDPGTPPGCGSSQFCPGWSQPTPRHLQLLPGHRGSLPARWSLPFRAQLAGGWRRLARLYQPQGQGKRGAALTLATALPREGANRPGPGGIPAAAEPSAP